MAGKDFLKRLWRALPQGLRLMFLKVLCLAYAQKRGSVAQAAPLFVCGAFGSASGLGQGARLYAAQRKESADVRCVDITNAMLMQPDARPDMPIADELPRGSGTVVIHANPPQFQLALCKLGRGFLRDKYLIAYWAWELEEIPDIWKQGLAYVDEVQVPSSFVRKVLQKHTRKRVSVAPHQTPAPGKCKTVYAGDNVLRCLYVFDMRSSFERKNPLAALRAFAGAFAPGEAELTFKIANPLSDNRSFELLRRACAEVSGVNIITRNLDRAELEELYLRHDVYLSLHRSEGYGLTIREAMLYGLHVVATAWSGNMDFMRGPLAHPVPYSLVPVGMDHGPYRGLKARWAEADALAAADILQNLRRQLAA